MRSFRIYLILKSYPGEHILNIFKGRLPGTRINVPIKFVAGGVVINEDYVPVCLLQDQYRESKEYLLVNPILAETILDEIKKLD